MYPLEPPRPAYAPKPLHKSVSNNRTQTLAKLRAVRDSIAHDLDHLQSIKERASLYARLLDTLDRIAVLSDKKVNTPKEMIDEIAARRTARRSAASREASQNKTRPTGSN